MMSQFNWKPSCWENAGYFIAYLVGFLFLVAYYALDYAVDIESGKLRYRSNIVANNEAEIFKTIDHTLIGDKFYKKYVTKREKEIVFSGLRDADSIKIKNIMTEEYPELIVHDWYKEVSYVRVVKDALSSGQLPFHVDDFSKIFKATKNRFLGSPIWVFSPQILLLYLLTPIAFIFVNHLLLYTIGAYGIIKLSNEHGLKFPGFILFFLIFNFNGHIIEKFSAYGPSQLGYYFIPFVLLYFFRLTKPCVGNGESKTYYICSIYLGIVLALILLQGTFHIYVQFVTFVIVWVFFNLSKLKYVIVSLAVSFAINAVRIMPAVITFGADPNKRGSGFTDPVMLFKSVLYPATQLTWPPFAWWEISVFISIFGFLILLKYSVIDPLIIKKEVADQFDYRTYIPIMIMILMAMWKVSLYLIPDFIPLLNSESHPHRYLIVPLIFLTYIASFNLSRDFDSMLLWKKVLLYLLLGMLLISLLDNLLEWRLLKIQMEVKWLFLNLDAEVVPGFNLAIEKAGADQIVSADLNINNQQNDFFYKVSFYVGLVISLASVFLTFFLLRRCSALKIKTQESV